MLGAKRQVLSEEIVEQILNDIVEGRLKPGDKLPSEKKLLEIYGVSRVSIREALRTLEIMNVIDIYQGKGAFISSLDPCKLVEHLQFVFLLDKSTVFSLFEARNILEPSIAALAAERASDAQIAELKELIGQGFDARVDQQLHEKIAYATGNPILIRFITSIGKIGEISRQKTSTLPGVQERAHKQHIRLVDAIAQHDAEGARARMAEHLLSVADDYRRFS
mgnify:CR=1 FL=1